MKAEDRLEERSGKSLDQELTRFPDEDKIEDIQQMLFVLAWESSDTHLDELEKVVGGLEEILSIWNKTLASANLSKVILLNYIDSLKRLSPAQAKTLVLREIDLIICFFHHYIYAFDEFLSRKFRNSVIRCGLICERVVKRLALASGAGNLESLKFEDRVNRLRNTLEGKSIAVPDLANFLQYVYRQRTARGAHDTRAATALTAKACMTTAPIIYMLYLDTLDDIGYKIAQKGDLVELVNSTISTGTSIVVSQEGHPVKVSQVLESLYRHLYFQAPKTLPMIQTELAKLGYAFPRKTLSDALNRISGREGILLKDGRTYHQRVPTNEYFTKEIID